MDRNVVNPHDEIVICYDDVDAARLAVILVGNGWYGIDGEDGVPLLFDGGHDKWSMRVNGVSFEDWMKGISASRLAGALKSMRIIGERSSESDPVGYAHKLAGRLLVNKE